MYILAISGNFQYSICWLDHSGSESFNYRIIITTDVDYAGSLDASCRSHK